MLSILLLLLSLLYWVILCVLAGQAGEKRQIGFWPSFLISFFFSPLFGLIFVALSPSLSEEVHRFKIHYELAQREEFKGNPTKAIDEYQNALFYLQRDYPHLSGTLEADRQRKCLEIKRTIASLQEVTASTWQN